MVRNYKPVIKKKITETHPDLIEEWDNEKNEKSPGCFTRGSSYRASWICKKCQNSWEAPIYYRACKGMGCPKCSKLKSRVGLHTKIGINDLATTHPNFAEEWHPTKNNLSPNQVTRGSKYKAWWVGRECGHEWKVGVTRRTQDWNNTPTGCPYCSRQKILKGFNDLATTHPHLAAEWHPSKNHNLLPDNVVVGSSKVHWWLCKKGHEWKTAGLNRLRGSNCPDCGRKNFRSIGEKELGNILSSEFSEENLIFNDCKTIGEELDIYIPRKSIAIEYNGIYYHSEALKNDPQRHYRKWKKCKEAGINLIQIWDEDWKRNPEACIKTIKDAVSDGNNKNNQDYSIELINQKTFDNFIKDNHIRGKTPIPSVRLGVFDNKTNLLLAVAGFKQVTIRSIKGFQLLVYCTVDGFSYLNDFVNFFKMECNPENVEKIFFISNNFYSNDVILNHAGFIAVGENGPDYNYFYKHKIFSRKYKTKSEWAKEARAYRIWDAGKTKWELVLN